MYSLATKYYKRTEQTKHIQIWLAVSTAKHTTQIAHEYSEFFLFGVGKLEMCKRNARPVCAQ